MKVRQGAALGVAPGHCTPPALLPMQRKHTSGSARVHLGRVSSAGSLCASLVTLKFQQYPRLGVGGESTRPDEGKPATRDGGAIGHTIDNLQNWVRSRPALQERGMTTMMIGKKDNERREVKVWAPF